MIGCLKTWSDTDTFHFLFPSVWHLKAYNIFSSKRKTLKLLYVSNTIDVYLGLGQADSLHPASVNTTFLHKCLEAIKLSSLEYNFWPCICKPMGVSVMQMIYSFGLNWLLLLHFFLSPSKSDASPGAPPSSPQRWLLSSRSFSPPGFPSSHNLF